MLCSLILTEVIVVMWLGGTVHALFSILRVVICMW